MDSFLEKPVLSIIIVNFNSGTNLQNTLSALSSYAKFCEVEIVLVDGGSDDASQEAIKINNGIINKLIVEPDDGIYDAMNKGINISSGEWVWFVNSGDLPIIDPKYLISFIKSFIKNEVNFIFSDLQINEYVVTQNFSLSYLIKSTINHQCMIYKKEIISVGFDTKYNFCADYAHLLQNINIIEHVKCPRNFCLYDLNGISSTPNRKIRLKIWKERLISQLKSPLKINIKVVFCLFSVLVIIIKFIFPNFRSIKKN